MNKKSQILKSLSGLVHEEPLKKWLQKPNAAFSNKIPMEMLDAGDFEEIENMILEMEHGIFS